MSCLQKRAQNSTGHLPEFQSEIWKFFIKALFSKNRQKKKNLRRKILFGMAFATMLVCISSCDKTKPSTNKLTGTWYVISIEGETLTADEKIVFDFRSDETFDFTVADSSAIGGGSAAGT